MSIKLITMKNIRSIMCFIKRGFLAGIFLKRWSSLTLQLRFIWTALMPSFSYEQTA